MRSLEENTTVRERTCKRVQRFRAGLVRCYLQRGSTCLIRRARRMLPCHFVVTPAFC